MDVARERGESVAFTALYTANLAGLSELVLALEQLGVREVEQAAAVVRSADRYLYDPAVGGYRLNTDFGQVQLNLGRCFGFAFGHKENGAMFSRIARISTSRAMYPGIPEYVNQRGRGAYPWLTGSASWYLLTLLTEAFGVRGEMGDLVLEPKLVAAQFEPGSQAAARAQFAGRELEIVYRNPHRLDYGAYTIESVAIDGEAWPVTPGGKSVRISRDAIAACAPSVRHQVIVTLGPNPCGLLTSQV